MGRVEDVGQDPAGRRAGRLVRRACELEHPRAEVDADDLLGALVPERERVAAAGALEVDRPPAAAVEVADELDLDAEQVRAARPDQRDGLVEPALVALGRLVPRGAVGRVHRADVRALRRRRRSDQIDVVLHRGEGSRAGARADDGRGLPAIGSCTRNYFVIW